MDLLDILEGRYDQTYAGRYFAKLPTPAVNVTQAPPEYFDYEYVDPSEWHYNNLLGNIIATDAANATVKTKSPAPFAVNRHVALQDGKLYIITSITADPRSVPKQAARMMIIPIGVEKILRLKEVEDPWGIGGAV